MSFKSYDQQQLSLLPPSLEELIPASDPVRVVNAVVERLNLKEVERQYKKTGCSAYHPRMMIKVIIYAYLRNTYSSRRIEDFVANDVRFMWLSGMQANLYEKARNGLWEAYKSKMEEMIAERVITKHKAYDYEKEWRLY